MMKHEMEKLEENLNREIEYIAQKDNLTTNDLEILSKLVSTKKNILKMHKLQTEIGAILSNETDNL